MDVQKLLSIDESGAVGEFKRRLMAVFNYQRFILLLWGSRIREECGNDHQIRLVVIGPEINRYRKKRILETLVSVEDEFEVFFQVSIFPEEGFEKLKRIERRLPFDIEREGIPI